MDNDNKVNVEIEALVNSHKTFTSLLFELIKSLLKYSDIKYHVVENRTKTVGSIVEKVSRKAIRNIEKDITDISGIRIILYYQDDVDRIFELIKSNFLIDDKNSANKGELYGSNEFGYLSTHYIISLNNDRSKLPEWQSYSEHKAEIQVRTVLQHSWASISHELTYKKDYEIPKGLQRKLFRLAGLFELADEQFLEIRDKHRLIKEAIETNSDSDVGYSDEINLLTLRHSFEVDSIYKKITALAIFEGFQGGENVLNDENLSQIIKVCEILGIESLEELKKKLEDNIIHIEKLFRTVIPEEEPDWFGDKSFYNLLALLTFLDENQLLEFFKNINGWSEDIIANIINKVLEVNNK